MSLTLRQAYYHFAPIFMGMGLPVFAEVRHVPHDDPSIQSCIDAAASGDECVVAPGTYNELIDFLGKDITLRSSHGPDVTIIDGSGLEGSVVTIANGESSNTVLDGFGITGGTGTLDVFLRRGGGIYIYGSQPVVCNCRFFSNNADIGGGGIVSYSETTISDCEFESNSASVGGGMCFEVSNVQLVRTRFLKNVTQNSSGAICVSEGSLRISDCDFLMNMSPGPGGAIDSYDCDFFVERCRFLGNFASTGGAIYNFSGSPTIRDCLFVGNSAESSGGAIRGHWVGEMEISNCTFAHNHAQHEGGAVYLTDHCDAHLDSCILWNNSLEQVDASGSGSVGRLQYCDISGGVPPTAVDLWENIDADPLFVRNPSPGLDGMWDGTDDDYGDLRLQPGSPAIDAGNGQNDGGDGETDLDGHARVLCEQIDIGAYEFGIADVDCDGAVNHVDFAGWGWCATDPLPEPIGPQYGGCEVYDFDGDGDIDLIDYSKLLDVFTP